MVEDDVNVSSQTEFKVETKARRASRKNSSLKHWLWLVFLFAVVVSSFPFWPKGNGDTDAISSNNRITYTVNGVEFAMIKVEGGTFAMGSSDNDSDANKDEKPIHQVTLNDFAIGETEVTQELWQAVMGGESFKVCE